MNKKTIALFLSILFMALISAPSIISAIDDSVDISIMYSITEEENENIKITLPDSNINETENLFKNTGDKHLGYQYKKYSRPHLNLVSPPPEVNI